MTSAEFLVAGGLFKQATYPTVDWTPSRQKLSLRLMGSPWSGPMGFPSRWMYSSRKRARSRASEKNVSVRHEVYNPEVVRVR